jgi:hypothetical protein
MPGIQGMPGYFLPNANGGTDQDEAAVKHRSFGVKLLPDFEEKPEQAILSPL